MRPRMSSHGMQDLGRLPPAQVDEPFESDYNSVPLRWKDRQHCTSHLSNWLRNIRWRKVSLLAVVLVAVIFTLLVALPMLQESRSAWRALHTPPESDVDSSRHHRLKEGVDIKTLDPALLPRPSKGKTGASVGKQRLVFVGDIHGCKKELKALLKKLDFDPVTDHLIAAGDVVTKGPDSQGVLDLLIKYEASCVRGNHDEELLQIAQDLASKEKSENVTGDDPKTSSNPVYQLAKSLSKGQLAYLQDCPLILRIGDLDTFGGEAIVVHAGLIPGLPLTSQDPDEVMNMRIIDLKSHRPSQKHHAKGSVDWWRLWNRYQKLQSWDEHLPGWLGGEQRKSDKKTTVIYGHNAREGLQIHKYSKGLDTGCVGGEKLTALVVDGRGQQKIFQVKSKQGKKGAKKGVESF
jgi:hypothetical protein